jgi:hypothetical protein
MDRGIDIHGQGNRNPWAGEQKSMGRGHKSMGRGTEIHMLYGDVYLYHDTHLHPSKFFSSYVCIT